MNLNLLKKMHFKIAAILVFLCSFCVMSCRGSENAIEGNSPGKYNVKINMQGITGTEETPAKSASLNKTTFASGGVQNSVINIDKDNYILASLTPHNITPKISTQASLNTMAATPVTTPLGDQIKYKIAVYDESGNFVTDKEFSYKQNDAEGFMLQGDHNYTFVAYSVNSTLSTDTPSVLNGGTLATAKLANINKDLMYFKKNMTVSGNQTNYLDVVLKHQFSQVNTILDARQVGTISNVVSTTISPAKTSADLSFNDNSLSYNSNIPGGASVNFPALNTQYVKSTATQIISPTNANGEINISSVTIDGVTRNNIKESNIKLDLGVKYDLRLRFGPCREDVSPANFDLKDGKTQTYTMPASDFGFEFNLYGLDNSFNMIINGVQLAAQEIQFEPRYANGQNIMFADDTKYEVNNNTPGIWLIKGDEARPMLKVVISKDGVISMYGSKASYGPLFPLKLFNNNFFNVITWNKTGTNTVVISQNVYGSATNMTGKGTGKREIQCTNP
ncbi:fimbrillin family protein [Elizabethkingia meningoseptica]|uniref:fimbrillin family protein n=1 Tax=Elizabethkingia meningoseptica TaxID=238 RepID=UPI000935EE71|nr:fimbrillin family protein [Elizabethkingia meningoseptica]